MEAGSKSRREHQGPHQAVNIYSPLSSNTMSLPASRYSSRYLRKRPR
jgi:hypothetical protein